MISSEQAENVKQQIIQQINSNFPEDKKEFAISQVKAMNNEQLENFLAQNNIAMEDGGGDREAKGGNQSCIFCSISLGNIPSHKIDENSQALAVLEINPISKGHVIIIPKEHSESIKETTQGISDLIKSVKEKIEKNLKPKKVEIAYSQMFNHAIINLLPIYENETLNSPRKSAEKSELEELQKILSEDLSDGKPKKVKKEIVRKPRTKKVKEKNLWLPRRVP
jgi:histidine triad (HIT) family protein